MLPPGCDPRESAGTRQISSGGAHPDGWDVTLTPSPPSHQPPIIPTRCSSVVMVNPCAQGRSQIMVVAPPSFPEPPLVS